MTDTIQNQWASKIIALLSPGLGAETVLIADPDHLLTGEIIRFLGEQNWLITPVHSPLELRLAYEQDVRPIPAGNLGKRLYVLKFLVSRSPFDILQDSAQIVIRIKDLFPTLNEDILRKLPTSWLAIIDSNLSQFPIPHKLLNEQQTTAFVLESCLGLIIPPRPSPGNALSLLADIALHNLELPPVLIRHMMERIGAVWPGDFASLLSAPSRARNFLQQVWQTFLLAIAENRNVLAEGGIEATGLAIDLLARDRNLQSQVSALLAENMIQAPTIQPSSPLPDWIRPGVHYHYDRHSFLNIRLAHIADHIPGKNATSSDWSEFAWQWADWRQNFFLEVDPKTDLHDQMVEIQTDIEISFQEWLQHRYTDLLSHPYMPAPTMVHHVLHYIAARFLPSEKHPLAMIVVDGMAIEDWLVIRKQWAEQDLNWNIQEHSLFALVPTITPVSRQALLSGQLPRNFAGDWLSTSTEEAAWRVFWEERDLHPQSIAYQRGLGYALEEVTELLLKQPHKAATALIVNTIDDLMHNNLLGSSALLQQVAIWGKQGYLRMLINRLLEQHETVIVTADHGHVEGRGIGDIALKGAAVERSLRTRIFADRAFETMKLDPKNVIPWRTVGLPENASVIIPTGLGIFAHPATIAISHGGAALEEVIIPFITITRMPA